MEVGLLPWQMNVEFLDANFLGVLSKLESEAGTCDLPALNSFFLTLLGTLAPTVR